MTVRASVAWLLRGLSNWKGIGQLHTHIMRLQDFARFGSKRFCYRGHRTDDSSSTCSSIKHRPFDTKFVRYHFGVSFSLPSGGWGGGHILFSFRPSVRPSVCPSVRPASCVRSGANFRRCVACEVSCKISKFDFFGICNFDFVLFSQGICCESLVWIIMERRGYLRTQAF